MALKKQEIQFKEDTIRNDDKQNIYRLFFFKKITICDTANFIKTFNLNHYIPIKMIQLRKVKNN